jgi:hypothetical protein
LEVDEAIEALDTLEEMEEVSDREVTKEARDQDVLQSFK